MSAISIKGVIVGAVADMIGSVVIGLVLGVVFAMGSHGNAAEVANDPMAYWATVILGSLVSIGAGYIAAAIARRAEILNGALSSFLCVAMDIFYLVHPDTPDKVLTLTLTVLTPILGMIGGYIRKQESA